MERLRLAHPLRGLTRSFRRTYHRLLSRGVPVVYDIRYQRGFVGVPLDPLRGDKVLGALMEAGLLAPELISEPRPVSLQNLLRVHTPDYLQSVQEPEALTRILGAQVPPDEIERTLDLQRLMAGGTIQATRLALRTGGVAVHLGGGFHHALPDAGLGFCVFNDIAVAIRRLQARGFDGRVLVVDLDLHDGNGTRRVFAADETVHTFSVHNEHWGETDAVESTAIALGSGVDDQRYLSALRETLPPVFARFAPQLVIYVAGTDVAHDDTIGNWKLTAAGLFERDRLVTSLVRGERTRCPMVVALAGGYGRRAWRYTARFLLWLATGRAVEPAEEDALVLGRFRRLRSELRPAEGADDGLPFSLSEEDIAGLMPGLGQPSRLLGYYSRHSVELLLERAGVLAQLRAKGLRGLRVELPAPGQTLRITSEENTRELLVELRAERSRSAVPGMEVISVEWLLLQNPRQPFSDQRPRLPGQQHPGLGLLRDFMGWLVAVCETHGLDGIFFVAAHYHIAVQSRRLVCPLQPADEARVRELARVLDGLPLAEAAAAVHAGRVVDVRGQPVRWEPMATVLPVSERLRSQVSGPEYEGAVQRERVAYRLAAADAQPSHAAAAP
jgi:acetoin utilization deacetylase AcuC-like enzyme